MSADLYWRPDPPSKMVSAELRDAIRNRVLRTAWGTEDLSGHLTKYDIGWLTEMDRCRPNDREECDICGIVYAIRKCGAVAVSYSEE